MVWRDAATIHFACDSRLSFGATIPADIAIKIVRDRYVIRGPDRYGVPGAVIAEGDIGMCFAGSGLGSVFLKESMTGVLGKLQAVPGHTNVCLDSIAALIFAAYKVITAKLCESLGPTGRSIFVIAAHCPAQKRPRAFEMSCDTQGQYTCDEVLIASGHVVLGSGATAAQNLIAGLGALPVSRDYLKILRSVIDDASIPGVGGSIQYGRLEKNKFQTFGVISTSEGVHYWRGALDLRDDAFERQFVINYPYLQLDDN